MEETGVDAATGEGVARASLGCSGDERADLPLVVTIRPNPFLVLLRRVTPIDHFPFVFSRDGGLAAQTWRQSNTQLPLRPCNAAQ
jgi:hypothetical protein